MPPPSRGLCESPTRWPLHTVGLCVPPSSRGLGKAPGWASWELPSGTALCQDLDAQRRQAPPPPVSSARAWGSDRPGGVRDGWADGPGACVEAAVLRAADFLSRAPQGASPSAQVPGRFLGEGFSPVAPSSSQTPRGSRTRPRWRRCGRRCMRPWRPTANTSTPSSQGGEPRPRPCQDLGVSGAACPPGKDTH